jgi:hypothetical protein
MMEIGRLDDLSIVLLCKKCDRVAGEYDPSEPNERIRKCPNPKCSDTEPWFPSFPDQGPEFLYVKQLKEALQAAIDLATKAQKDDDFPFKMRVEFFGKAAPELR